MEKLGLNLGYLIAFTLSFGIMFVVLREWAFKPLLGMLEKRRQAIARGLEDARVAADARANAEKEANKIISEAQTRAAEVIREATERASKVDHEIRQQAETDASRARESAMVELEGERNRMLSELRGQIVALAIAAAQKLISENLDEKRQRALVNNFFSGAEGGKVAILQGFTADSDGVQTAEVTSALPLTEDEQSTVRNEVTNSIGHPATITFRVDPTILGGLIVRIGDRVVDGSLSGQLEDLRQNLH